jgi:hypothetical protein
VKIKGQVQSLLIFFTQGIGMFFGSIIAGKLFNSTVTGKGEAVLTQWKNFWLIPSVASFVIAIIFLILFKKEKESASVDKITTDNSHIA